MIKDQEALASRARQAAGQAKQQLALMKDHVKAAAAAAAEAADTDCERKIDVSFNDVLHVETEENHDEDGEDHGERGDGCEEVVVVKGLEPATGR